MALEREHLSTKQVAAMTGMCVWWVRQRQKEIGVGPDYFRIGKKIFYRRSDVEAWMEAHRNRTSPDPP